MTLQNNSVNRLKKPRPSISVNLDEADRPQIVAAGCMQVYLAGGRAWEIAEWKRRSYSWDDDELLHRCTELGVRFLRSNRRVKEL